MAMQPKMVRLCKSFDGTVFTCQISSRWKKTDKILAMLQVIIYGALLIFCVTVTFTTNVGFWGVAGTVGLTWLIRGPLKVIFATSGKETRGREPE
jgi:hypothetical protein